MHCNCFSGISRFNCYNMSNVSQPFNSSCYLAIKDQVTSEHSLTFLFWKFQCYKWSTRALTSFFAPARWTFVVLDIIQLHFQSFFTIFDSRWPKSLCLDGEPLPPGTTAETESWLMRCGPSSIWKDGIGALPQDKNFYSHKALNNYTR